ncbi:nucleoporin-62 C-terminal-like protein isoform X2 [Eleutherodactylus coqui]|uniref:nucleoporin-62 C-terminal-like protein isoform X2 n=1 Tax=Eleutherodactylus coqui TaxID=57060 RepID=UPI003462F380
MSSFNFGTNSSAGGFAFGTPKTTAPTAATGFSFGGAAAPSAGFSFGAATQTPAATAPQPNQPTGLFSFATPAPTTTAAAAAAAAPTSGFSFGAQPTAATSAGGLVLGNTVPKLGLGVAQPAPGSTISGATQTSGFSFGAAVAQPNPAPSNAPAAAGGGGFNFTGAVTTTVPPTTAAATTQAASNAVQAPVFCMPTPLTSNIATATTAPAQAAPVPQNPNLFGKPPEPAQVTVLSSTTTAAPSTLGLSASLTTPAASLFSIPTTTSAPLANKPQATVVVPTITSGPTVVSAPSVMTYAQLENLINKWSLELEDQEKHFLQQATQVNAWDRTLIQNGERITALHREMEKVKLDQKRLDQELDFILSQQKELEDLLTPLEESVKEQSGTIYLQHADEEREKTYKLAENIDAQLKRMAQDLKDVIEHLNTTAGPGDASNPLQQICKILNAHVDSLQWIDQNSALLQRKVEQVAKECESRRKEQERGFSITFD